MKDGHRLIEIDSLRGLALVMMISFHFLWDMNYLNILRIDLYSLPQSIYAYSIGSLFLFLVGVSLSLSYSRAKKDLDNASLYLKYILRGLRLMALGAIITIVTFLYLGNGFIVFGVISCIGLSVVLVVPLLNRPTVAFPIGIAAIVLGIILQQMTFKTYWLLWLGFVPETFYSADYFPLLPWFGVILLGLSMGRWIYGDDPKPKIKNNIAKENSLAKMGRHSLLIYIIHQPILLAALFMLVSIAK